MFFGKFEYLVVIKIMKMKIGNDKDCINKISKILDMHFISIKSMKWKFSKIDAPITFQEVTPSSVADVC